MTSMNIGSAIAALQSGGSITNPDLERTGKMIWLLPGEGEEKDACFESHLGRKKNAGTALFWHPTQSDLLRCDYTVIEDMP